ncbi:MAG TPA: 3-oxoadipate enol-lactonase [Thermoleophilia bacterium]|nr:3-oxoadipate enol-lactonase [Thermoleophilia bacterium]
MPAVELAHRIDGPAGAPVVVLSGSLGSDTAVWEPQLPELARSHRVLRYDHRGHARSPVPPGPYTMADLGGDVLALLDALGIERCAFCGLSLGGAVGMWLAVHAPERIERLVLCSTSARFGPAEMWLERAALVRSGGPVAIADATMGRWFTPALHRRDPGLIARFRETFVATPAEGYAGCCEALAGWSFGERLGEIRAPTLMLSGADDPSTPTEPHARILAEGIAGARLVVIPGAAHLANVERPDLVTPRLAAHLRGTE